MVVAPRLRRLINIAQKPSRKIVGLMSGTSVDGIDAVLVEITGSYTETQVHTIEFLTRPFEESLRDQIHAAFEGDVGMLCELNFILGEAFADAALKVVEKAGLKMSEIDAIASPGQTIFHIDPTQGGVPSTLQLGESSIIAERTGCIVVSDFRTRDIAAGGSGAPLVPYVDFILFAQKNRYQALQNIGGIANVTLVPPQDRPMDLLAFDTGPGNMIIDEIVKELRDDNEAVDEGGRFSALGRVDEELLGSLMDMAYFRVEPPKSTGREMFGIEFCRELVEKYDPKRLIDLLSTVVQFTATSIFQAYDHFILPKYELEKVVISGGGVHNKTLMNKLKELFATRDIEVMSWDELTDIGFTGDAKEAVAFAVLANETLQGQTSGCPAATGASKSVIQGKIVL
jgi:anhydro-N-acetylmuramic acid kinase